MAVGSGVVTTSTWSAARVKVSTLGLMPAPVSIRMMSARLFQLGKGVDQALAVGVAQVGHAGQPGCPADQAEAAGRVDHHVAQLLLAGDDVREVRRADRRCRARRRWPGPGRRPAGRPSCPPAQLDREVDGDVALADAALAAGDGDHGRPPPRFCRAGRPALARRPAGPAAGPGLSPGPAGRASGVASPGRSTWSCRVPHPAPPAPVPQARRTSCASCGPVPGGAALAASTISTTPVCPFATTPGPAVAESAKAESALAGSLRVHPARSPPAAVAAGGVAAEILALRIPGAGRRGRRAVALSSPRRPPLVSSRYARATLKPDGIGRGESYRNHRSMANNLVDL